MYADNDYSHDPHAQMDPRTSYSDDSDGYAYNLSRLVSL